MSMTGYRSYQLITIATYISNHWVRFIIKLVLVKPDKKSKEYYKSRALNFALTLLTVGGLFKGAL